jgi:quercetin dioxygenase-like cupin family protein
MEYVRKVAPEALAGGGRVAEALLDHGSGATSAMITLVQTPPGEGSPAGLHTHRFDQAFYLMSGTMSLEIGGEPHEAGPGTLVLFPAGVPHRNWNAGTEPTVHLAINTPLPDPELPFADPV